MKFFSAISDEFRSRKGEFILELGYIFIVGLIYWPITKWVFAQTIGHEQFLQALLVIGFAAYFLIHQRSGALSWNLKLDSLTMTLTGISFLALILASLLKWHILLPVGFCAALAGGCVYFFGKKGLRQSYPLLIVFLFYIFLMVLYPVFDFPLRAFAAEYSEYILSHLNLATNIYVINEADPRLMLNVSGRTFEVAPECNGFGLMSASFLLSILIAMKSSEPILIRSLGIIVAVFLASLGNLLRIVAIILLAPHFPNHYHSMHEVVGIVTFFAVLWAVGWLLWRGPGLVKKSAP